MRKMIYLGLTEWLKGLKDGDGQPLIRHIDLWNEQVEFIEQEEPFATPAVFIEFRPVQWATLGGTAQQADVPFRLHVVTTWQGSAKDGSPFRADALDRFDLLDRITQGGTASDADLEQAVGTSLPHTGTGATLLFAGAFTDTGGEAQAGASASAIARPDRPPAAILRMSLALIFLAMREPPCRLCRHDEKKVAGCGSETRYRWLRTRITCDTTDGQNR